MQTIEFRTKIKNDIIQMPACFKGQVADDNVQVLLISKSEKSSQPDIIDNLMAHPLQVSA